MSSCPAGGLLFLFRELVDEVVALKRIAKNFLAPDGPGVLTALEHDMERIGETTTDRVQELVLQPLRTQSTRDYEPGTRSGGQKIYALMSGKWEVQPVGRQTTPAQDCVRGQSVRSS